MSTVEQGQVHNSLLAYHRACHASDSEEARSQVLASLDVSLFGQIITEALVEAHSNVSEAHQPFESELFEEDITLVRELCKRNPLYTIENVRTILPLLTALCEAEVSSDLYGGAVLEVVNSFGEFLQQPEVMTQCQAEVAAFYAQVGLWGAYHPVTEAYRLRILIQNVLASDTPHTLKDLLQTVAAGKSRLSDEELVRTILDSIWQEYWNTIHSSQDAIFDLIKQQTSSSIQVQLIQATLKKSAQNEYLDGHILQALASDKLPYTSEAIQEILHTTSNLQTQGYQAEAFYRACLVLVNSVLPALGQPALMDTCRNEVVVLHARLRNWQDTHSLTEVYHTRLLLEDLLFSEDAPGLAPLLRRINNSAHQPQEEQALALLAAYRQDVGDAEPLYYCLHPTLELLQQQTSDQLKVLLVRVVLQEIYTLYDPSTWSNNPLKQAIAFLNAVEGEHITYTIDDVDDMLQKILNVFSVKEFNDQHYNDLNASLFRLLQRLEPFFSQPDVFARCQKILKDLYALTIHWGNYYPIQDGYHVRMMLGNLLFAGNPPGLRSLLREYARGEGPSLQEQARTCLAVYHQELGLYHSISAHPLQEMLVQEAHPRLRVQIIQEAFADAYAHFRPRENQSEHFFQTLFLLDMICVQDLPYHHDDIRAILQHMTRIFLLPDGEYDRFKGYYRSKEMTLHYVFETVNSRFTSAELLAFCQKEMTQLYYAVSQCRWYRYDAWENMMRLQLRSMLFPESAGPLHDMVQVAPTPLEQESDLRALLAAYYQDLACGTPFEVEPAIVKRLNQKLTPQSTLRLLSLLFEEERQRRQEKAGISENPYQPAQTILLLRTFCKKTLPYRPEDVHTILHALTTLFSDQLRCISELLVTVFATHLSRPEVLAACYADLEAIRQLADAYEYTIGDTAHERRFRLILQDLFSKRDYPFDSPFLPDVWAISILKELKTLSTEERDPWLALLYHCAQATMSVPTSKWQKQAQTLMAALDSATATTTIHRWIGFFTSKKGERMDGNNSNILRGLIWLCIGSSDRALAAVLADTAIEGYHKMPGLGPRCPKAGDAAIVGLEGMRGRDAISQLERVRRNVKQPSYQAKIGSALDAVAQREQMTRQDLEELMIPTFDLQDGQLQIPVDTWMAHLHVGGRGVQQRWIDPEGKSQKNLPAAIKRTAKEELKALTLLVKDIEHLVTDQRDRLERLYLSERHWTLEDWRERYLDHALLSVLARYLIWQVRSGSQSWRVIWYKGDLVDLNTQPVSLPEDAEVSLWHPLMSTTQEVQRWCVWLETQRITQPFRQAHREIYPLTDAERISGRLSQRFAGHFIRQHQLNALARARGWQFSLHSNFSGSISDDPVTLHLPHLEIRAEFVVNRQADEDEEIPRYLVTSPVRFLLLHLTQNGYYHNVMQLQPLEQIPPLVFSEVMRDIDLFVSVTSLGADPHAYAEPGELQDYWQSYNQEELSLSAQGRKLILERLVPMLEIGDQCSFEDRFLCVRGDFCTYRIHLGSGNVMMEPGYQYLCIVYDAKTREATEGQFFLPFEGDPLLALILSKALLLAADKQIKDKSILSQIRSRQLT